MAEPAGEKYRLQYFTGVQASIWVGDIWVEDVNGIQFQGYQNIIPLYGYASAKFNAIARGRILVTGYFDINFTNEGYLYYILHEKNSLRTDRTQDVRFSQALFNTDGNFNSLEATSQLLGDETGVAQRLAEFRSAASATMVDRQKTINEMMDLIASTDLAGINRASSELEFLNKMQRERSNGKNNTSIIYDVVPFDLVGIFGNPSAVDIAKYGTQKRLTNCILTNNEQYVAMDDSVIKERYSFIAQIHQ